MGSARSLTLICGLLCALVGGVLVVNRRMVEGAVWLGIPIALGGLILIGITWRSARRGPASEQNTGSSAGVPKPPGLWFPIGLGVILTLQAAYLIWWTVFGRK